MLMKLTLVVDFTKLFSMQKVAGTQRSAKNKFAIKFHQHSASNFAHMR